ncbi:DUF6541 family protein [Microbacterium sp. NPDC055521]
MILAWISSIPAVLAAAVVVFVPGCLVLWGFRRVRGLSLIALAPIASVAMFAVAALLLGLPSIGWSVASFAGTLLVMALAAWGLGQLFGPPRVDAASPRSARWLLPVGIALGVILGAWRLISYIQDPAGISQTNDSVFHMNAIRHALDTADVSSLHLTSVIGGTGFYPAAWHALVSMTVLLSGTDIAVSVNAITLIVGAAVWPLGIAWMVRVITRSDRIAALAAVMSPALQTFPLLMFQWGVLFPNALSVSLLPAAVAAVIVSADLYDPAHRLRSSGRIALIIAMTMAALALSHPAALPIWGLMLVIWFTDRMLRAGARPTTIAAAIAAWLLLAGAWYLMTRGTDGAHWPPFRGKVEALLEVVVNGQLGIAPAWVISAFMAAGLVVALRAEAWRWLVVVWLGFSALYVLVAAVGMPVIRDVLLGPWYADPYRLAALAPMAVIPLAAIGIDRLARVIVGRGREVATNRRQIVVAMAAAAVAMSGITFWRPVPMPAFLQGTFDTDSRYLTTSDSYLSEDERALLESLDDYVPSEARVIANPSTGAAFGYMLSGRDVYPRTWTPPKTAEWDVIAEELRDVSTEPAVCDALASMGSPAYVLDFGEGELGPGRFVMPGLTDFAGRPGFELVAKRGDASLWQITACED